VFAGRFVWVGDRAVTAYDTIRDAILMCARKPTLVSLICRTGPTTKTCGKTEKLTSNKWICSEVTLNSLGFHVVSPEEEKEGCGGKDLQKRKVLSLELNKRLRR